MAVVIKSNIAIKLKRLSEIITRALNPVLEMDFRNGYYTKNGLPFSDINQTITLNQFRNGFYDNNLEYHYNNVFHSPQVTIDPDNFHKGLLVDSESGNWFLNSNSPETQVVTFVSGLGKFHHFRVFGDGKIIIRNNLTDEIFGEATEGNGYYRLVTEDDRTRDYRYKVEVVGNPDFVEANVSQSSRYQITRTQTTTKSEASPAAKAMLTTGLTSELLPTRTGTLIIKTHLPKPIYDRSIFKRITTSVAYIGNGSNGVHIGFRENDTTSGITATARSLSTSNLESAANFKVEDIINFARTQVHAISFSPSGYQYAYNGNIYPFIATDALTGADTIYIGSAPSWSTDDANIVEQFILYGEQLTEEELIAITSA